MLYNKIDEKYYDYNDVGDSDSFECYEINP